MSIRSKILSIVLGFFILTIAVFFVYSFTTTKNYRELRTNEVTKTVAYESERVNKTIAEMKRNANDLALSGKHYFNNSSQKLGESIVIDNFSAFTKSVGGGIWFEPFTINENKIYNCYYAFFDNDLGKVRYDSNFESVEYDYHTQSWYLKISADATIEDNTVWTLPYTDETGSNALMTTVGSGIYDNNKNLVGMSTVDWEIQSVVDTLSAIKPTPNSFVILASVDDNSIISNTYGNENLDVGKPLDELSWYKNLNFANDNEVGKGNLKINYTDYISFSQQLDNGWLFSVQIPAQEIFEEIEENNNRYTSIIISSSIILLLLTFLFISNLVIKPLGRLTKEVKTLGDGNLDRQIEVHSLDEIGMLATAFNKMTFDLKKSIETITYERAEKERIGAELSVATKIQSSMLPCIFPAFPDRKEFDIYANMLPAKEVGGDFYDFFLIDKNKLAIVIADVSGKGVPAALFMVIAKTLIKNNAQLNKSPKEVFEIVNNLLCENNEAAMFVTAFMGYLDIKTGLFTYVNAGHNPPIIKKSDGNFSWLPTKAGLVLAGLEDMQYKQDEIQLNCGDTLFLYTDGVTEAVNLENELFTEQLLLDIVNVHKDNNLKELLVAIKSEIDKFANGAEQADDITMLALRIEEGGV